MQFSRRFLASLIALAAAGVMDGCGGGGSSPVTATTTHQVTPVTVGDYKGTYDCMAISGSDEKFEAVLPTASGAFSNCSGSVDAGSDLFTCTGSISPTGDLVVNKADGHGVTSTNVGTVTPASISGTFTAPSVNVSGTFSCTHSD
jgi:hypothetical protein